MTQITPIYTSKQQRAVDCAFYMKMEGIDKLLKKPFPIDQFVNGPASANYHGNYSGGLFEHSLTVGKQLSRLTASLNLKWDRPESPAIVGLFHDICKMNVYKRKPMSPTESWEYIPDNVLDGHGEKSVMMIQEYIDLTEEELLCIRWHMGAYETDTSKWDVLGRAIDKYPNVLFAHTADMMASHIEGV